MYYYHDYDDYKNEDITIEGEDYAELIETCFRYSSYFSLSFASKEIEQRVMKSLTPLRRDTENRSDLKYRCFYKCTEEAKTLFLTNTNDLFEWRKLEFDNLFNPENPRFYREDGSVFFWSEIHEGNCYLYNNADEDVTSIVSKRGWQYKSKNRVIFY